MSVTRIAAWAMALLIGAFYGAAGTISQAYTVWGIPVGMLMSIGACAAVLIAVRALTEDRWAALSAGLGMMVMTLVLSGEGPGGSVVVPVSILGAVWTLAVPVIVTVVVAWPRWERVAPSASVSGA